MSEMSKIKLLLLVIDLILFYTVESSKVHYITPFPATHDSCPGESCLTLSMLAANFNSFDSNTTLVFLEGSHILDSKFVVSDINGSLMLSTNASAAIICNSEGSLEFFNITHLLITGLEFIRCSNKVELVNQFTLKYSRFHDRNDDSALRLNHTNTSIVQSSFVSNTAGTYQNHVQVLAYIWDSHSDISDGLSWPNIHNHSTSARVGGALLITSSTVFINSSHFVSNSAKVGGAIFSQKGSNVTITNCKFVNNSATGCSDNGCHGGALFIDSGCTVTAHSSTFINNRAGYAGGAIALFQGTFLDSAHNVFRGNRAGTLGGAISAYDRSKITIDSSHYSNNRGEYGGTVFTYRRGSITVGNSSFANNQGGSKGGVIVATNDSRITVGNSSFDKNEAGRYGGVMHASYSSSITVGNSSFDYNEAGWNGGVMYAYSSSSITVGNSSFDNNEAGWYGGVMYAFSSTITVGNSYFHNNEAHWHGGIIYAFNSVITMGNSFFDSNVAGYHGGVMYAGHNSIITVINSAFDSNEADNDGGVMHGYYYSRITVGNSSFDNNKAGNDGGIMSAWDSSSITVGNSSFDSNKAGNDGGVISAWDSSSITVGNSSFDSNKASNDGGVMSAYSSRITVGNSSFDNNVASYDGGVMSAWESSSISVSNSSFGNNEAGNDGGVMYAHGSRITVGNSSFDSNEASNDGGVMSVYVHSGITVGNSFFNNNEAGSNGGVMSAYISSNITVGNSSFDCNIAGSGGGVVYAYSNTIMNSCIFFNNSARDGGVINIRSGSFEGLGSMFLDNTASNGGVIILDGGGVNIVASSFLKNTAANIGGVLYVPNYAYKHHIALAGSAFESNQAPSGGVIALLVNDELIVMDSTFSHNSAIRGGTIYLQLGNTLTVKHSNFSHNSASSDGGVIYSADTNEITIDSSVYNFNTADNNGGVLFSPFQIEITLVGDKCTFIGNQGHRGGIVYASESKINVYCQSLLMANNTAIDKGGTVYLSGTSFTISSGHNTIIGNTAKSGGAIFATDSQLEFSGSSCNLIRNLAESGGAICIVASQLIFSNGSSKLVGNQADYGGAIYASESKLVVEVNSWANIGANVAIQHGGGLYMTKSELNANGYNLYINENQANGNGGGIHADNSSILIKGEVHIINNDAGNGGAISLERNTKLKGKLDKNDSINLVSNRAKRYGGALYVDDTTNPQMCAAVLTAKNETVSSKAECFSKSVFIQFSNNSAGISGMNLFGGLLDRCIVHTESYQENKRAEVGLSIFQSSSNINESQLETVSSSPVRLCFCQGSQPDCDYQPEPIQVNRGKAFSLQLIAYNHILRPVRATVDIDSSASGKIAGQYIDEICTDVVLQFNLFTHVDYANLTLSIIGPCDVAGISMKSVIIQFTCICPIGFKILSNNMSCDCVCDQVLQLYEKTECNPTTESIIRKENFWISYINHPWSNSSGYVIYPHCPFDYCYTPDKSVSVNLNLPNGSDAQCDSNRMGILCGTCKPGLSVSLGSSKCISCPTYWPGLLVTITTVFIISGIGLVALLLALNLTVAIGTLNAIIFYANIIAANRSALFPSGVSFASVFISWLNFDLGFDACFFDGMDTYAKTWLQLAFPAYIIFLVVVIIQLSYYFSAFGCLVGKKDPVATLATLILLSYAKLLQTIITAFSSATLDYPDGSKKTLWLPDATLEYFTSKHAMLFFIAIIILLAGFIYTFLLFLWQWFLWCPRKRVKWVRKQKLSSFIELYLVPYTPKHRYWTGLLLLVRASVYLLSAFNPSGDPKFTLSTTTFIMTSLVIYIATFGVRMYKNWFINSMETLTYFNIIGLSIFTWYTIDADTNQTAITNVSVGITFIQLTAVILYHAYKHMNQKLFTVIQGSAICIKLKKKLIPQNQKRVNNNQLVPVDEDIHQFHMLLDMIDRPANTNDYNIPQVQSKPVVPTKSVVEIPKPIQAAPGTPPPPPLEAIKEEPELKHHQQEEESEQDITPVTENLATEINKNKQCINNCPGIEISECDDTHCTNPGNGTECSCTILEEKSVPKSQSNPQIHSYSDIKQAKEAMEMTQSDDKGQSSQDVPSDSGQQEGCGSHCITVEAEIHDY